MEASFSHPLSIYPLIIGLPQTSATNKTALLKIAKNENHCISLAPLQYEDCCENNVSYLRRWPMTETDVGMAEVETFWQYCIAHC